jgi:hypothetical protein
MRITLTRKYSRGTRFFKYRYPGIPVNRYSWIPVLGFRSSRIFRDQRGQGMLEYLLVLMVVLGVIFVAARPVIARLQKKFEKGIQGGIFREDPTGEQFYYFPLK